MGSSKTKSMIPDGRAAAKTESVKPKRMRVTGILCPRCGDKVWSRHRHDYRHCKCGYCAIDGGQDYTKVSHGVSLPEGRKNDGTVTQAEWDALAAENARIGRPQTITMLVPRPPERTEQEWPYPGWSSRLMRELVEQAMKEHKKKPKKEKSDELSKQGNRKQTDSVQPATRGSKRRPSIPIRTGKNKATVRK